VPPHVEEQAAATQEKLDGYRDQEMARLFIECEWSQEQLASYLTKRRGDNVSPDWVSKRLRFGRFLSFFNTACVEEWRIPINLTERAFRRFWEATEAAHETGPLGVPTALFRGVRHW
jgi:hypothetical protein